MVRQFQNQSIRKTEIQKNENWMLFCLFLHNDFPKSKLFTGTRISVLILLQIILGLLAREAKKCLI